MRISHVEASMLQMVLQCTGQPHTKSCSDVEKPWCKLVLSVRTEWHQLKVKKPSELH